MFRPGGEPDGILDQAADAQDGLVVAASNDEVDRLNNPQLMTSARWAVLNGST